MKRSPSPCPSPPLAERVPGGRVRRIGSFGVRQSAGAFYVRARISAVHGFNARGFAWELALLCVMLAGPRADGADWQNIAGGRSAPLQVAAGGQPGFTLVPPATTGVFFTNVLPVARHLTNQVLLNGSGVAAGDVD